MHLNWCPCSAQEASDYDYAGLGDSWMLARVLLPDALPEEVLIEDVNVREEVLNVLRLHFLDLLGCQLLEEALRGLTLAPGASLQTRVHPVQPL